MSPSRPHATPKLSENCVLAGQMQLKTSLVLFVTTWLAHHLPLWGNSGLASTAPICSKGRVSARVALPVSFQEAPARCLWSLQGALP